MQDVAKYFQTCVYIETYILFAHQDDQKISFASIGGEDKALNHLQVLYPALWQLHWV